MNSASRKRALRYATSHIKNINSVDCASFFERAYALLLLSRAGLYEDVQGRIIGHSDLGKNSLWIEEQSLRDVALMFLALYTYSSELISGAYAARFAKRMISHETRPGGPYVSQGRKPDVETNAIIAQLFEAFGTPLHPTLDFLRLQLHVSSATVYLSPFFFWPKALYKNDARDEYDIEHLSREACLDWIVNVHSLDRTYATRLIALGKDYWRFSGCSVWFSAVLLRNMIGVHQTYRNNSRTEPPSVGRIVKLIDDRFSLLDEPVRGAAKKLQRTILGVDSRHEITQFVFDFVVSLSDHSLRVSDELCAILGAANFYFWMAYTIYDDFIDDEGDPAQLSIANITQRDSLRLYEEILGKQKLLHKRISDYFDKVDEANAWELKECRLVITHEKVVIKAIPKYGDKMILAQRSMGHVLGPLLVIGHQSAVSDKKISLLCDGLRQYLIARQLNDDLYDWEKDIRQGHVSYVVARILTFLHLVPATYEVDTLCDEMRTVLWDKMLVLFCDEIDEHCFNARRLMRESGVLVESGIFYDYIGYIEASVRESRDTYSKQRQFLDKYSRD